MSLSKREELELLALLEEEEKEAARNSYVRYCEYTHHGHWKPARHHAYVCEALERVIAGEITRLMIFMPPRHGKSMTVTETFPSYFLGKFPEKRVIEVSYGDALAQRFGKLNRQKVIEFGKDLFGIAVSKEKSSMTDWDVEGHRGGMISAGIGGGITGQGADLLLIDDPIKNKEEAESEVYREKVWSEWQNTLRTRLHPAAAVIIILTRWHEDDLAGRLLNPEYGEVEDWHIISLPAIAEEDDQLGRKEGEPLWPEHGYGLEWAEATKKGVGSQTWAALYQQRPSPIEGAMLKRHWWKFYDRLPDQFVTMIQSWDCAFKDLDTSDYVVGQVWGKIGADMYLVDQFRDRMNLPTTIQAIENMSRKWPKAVLKLVEDKANGPAVIQLLRRKLPGMLAVNPEGGKVARASAVSPAIEAGNVYLPSPAISPWINDFIEECASFPNGKNDDQVDAMTQALNRFIYFAANLPPLPPKHNFNFERPKPDPFVGAEVDRSYIDF